MAFNLDEAIKIANEAVFTKFSRKLTDVEIIVLKGAWERKEYDQIAVKHQYASSYISQHIAPKLWKLLTYSLGEKVKKSNFKEALKRAWENQIRNQKFASESYLSTKEIRINKAQQPYPQFNPSQELKSCIDSQFYVPRYPLESLCYEHLLHPGSLIRIKAPKLMGKTLLIEQLLIKAAKHGYRTVSLSLEMAERKTHCTNLNKFLRWFCFNVSRELHLPSEIDEYWDEEGMGAKVSCTTYLEEYLLADAQTPLVLCLDDVDVLFPYPEVYEDFFGLLRSWHEKARSRSNWKKLRLVIAHATDVYIQLNINQSPFNVGLPIQLPELTREEVEVFARQYGLAGDSYLVDSLMQLVGGHPYLLKMAFSHLTSYPDLTLEQLLVEAVTDAGIYSHHLRDHWLSLQQESKLMAAFQTVINSDKPVKLETISAYQLQSMGLVKLAGNEIEPRCQLYCNYFAEVIANHSNKL